MNYKYLMKEHVRLTELARRACPDDPTVEYDLESLRAEHTTQFVEAVICLIRDFGGSARIALMSKFWELLPYTDAMIDPHVEFAEGGVIEFLEHCGLVSDSGCATPCRSGPQEARPWPSGGLYGVITRQYT